LVNGPKAGWGSPVALATAVARAALLGALVVIERRAVDPWCRRRC
jgi:hypothetical protein